MMADIPNPTFDNIPRLTPTVESYHYRQPLFRSPENGPIVELFDGVFHAHPITDEMLEEGRWMAFADFQRAAPDAGISIPASSRGFSYVFYRQYVRAIHESRLAGFSHPHIPPYRYDGWGALVTPRAAVKSCSLLKQSGTPIAIFSNMAMLTKSAISSSVPSKSSLIFLHSTRQSRMCKMSEWHNSGPFPLLRQLTRRSNRRLIRCFTICA